MTQTRHFSHFYPKSIQHGKPLLQRFFKPHNYPMQLFFCAAYLPSLLIYSQLIIVGYMYKCQVDAKRSWNRKAKKTFGYYEKFVIL